MRLISLIFTISLFVGFINCTDQSDQNNKSTSIDKTTVQAIANSNQPAKSNGPEPLKIESRQISSSPHHSYNNQDAQASNINIYTTNLSPKDTAHLNPNSPLGYIKIQPVLAPLSSHQTPESQGSTTFLSFIKPKHHHEASSSSSSRRSFSLTSKLKNLMSSLFWKDNSNYMTSGSSYSFSLKPPPQFNTMNSFQFQPPPNYANNIANFGDSSLASSQYKPIVFQPTYQQQASNNNFNKYSSSFNGPQFANSANSASSSFSAPYYQSNLNNNNNNNNGGYNPNYMRNNNNLAAERNNMYNSAHTNTGFPPSSYQVAHQSDSQASSSNSMNAFASPSSGSGNQYSNNNNNNQPDTNAYSSNNNYNNNQRLSAAVTENSSPVNSKAIYSATDSSSSVTGAAVSNYDKNSLPLTNSNPVSLIKTNNKQQQFGSY